MKKFITIAAAFAAGTVAGGAFVAAGLGKEIQKVISEKLSEMKNNKKKDEDEPEPAEASADSEEKKD